MVKKVFLGILLSVFILSALSCGVIFAGSAFAEEIIVVVYEFEGETALGSCSDGAEIYGCEEFDDEETFVQWSLNGNEVDFPYSVSSADMTDGKIVFTGKRVQREETPIEEDPLPSVEPDENGKGENNENTENNEIPTDPDDDIGGNEPIVNPVTRVDELICEHSEITVEGTLEEGTLVEITVFNFEEGYALDSILVSSDGKPVSTTREGNRISFIMPTENISVIVVFKASVSPLETQKSPLGTKEIIGIAVAATILAVGAIVLIVKSKKK